MTQKVLFSGSREASPMMLEATHRYLMEHIAGRDILVIVGDADGVDLRVIQTCDENDIPVEVHGAYRAIRHKSFTGQNISHDTDYHGRDRIMANLIGATDRAVIVWNGISRQSGTWATARAVSRNTMLVYWLWAKMEG
jgi:hypothetical protein